MSDTGGTEGDFNWNYIVLEYERTICTDFQPFRLFRDGVGGNNEYRRIGDGGDTTMWWLRSIKSTTEYLRLSYGGNLYATEAYRLGGV